MRHFRIKNWERFQHYKDRNPPWIKLHRDLLTSETWVSVDDASRVLAIACMLIAAATDNKIPDNPKYVQRVAYLTELPDFSALVEVGFLEVLIEQGVAEDRSDSLADASSVLAKCSVSAQETETETEKKRLMSGKPDHVRQQAEELIEHLNALTGRSYRMVESNIRVVTARLREGATVEQAKAVIAAKVKQWGRDPKMAEYLRPETLFNATKFEQYLGQIGTKAINGHDDGVRFEN
ncbi:putative phage protein (TIGR02220 family) [Paraburkholderia silvatlantica]|uniref:Putative phage protein (TIGR02220 family) n=2 Tax=Paraburkholderia silvatlantica TaxID=321895 RepID=A0A2V4TC21_9BURK|nr:putative phage protein (TIGR02220 family) [Paraburkholderia silvatlantica]